MGWQSRISVLTIQREPALNGTSWSGGQMGPEAATLVELTESQSLDREEERAQVGG